MLKLLCLTSAVLLAVVSYHGIVVGEAAIKSGDVEEKDANSVEDLPKNATKLRLPESFYLKAYSYMKNSKAFKNFTFEDAVTLIDDLDTWEAPEEIQRRFPYYHAGYDYEDRPIWIAEAGKYNVREFVERGGEDLQNLERYCFQASIRILRSIQARDRPGREVREGTFVGDCEGLDMRQVSHLPTVTFVLSTAIKYRDIIEQGLGRIIVINANFVTQIAADIVRPFAGRLMERVDIYGTNKAKWIQELRRILPEETIPTWYGGPKDFTPVKVYG